MFTVETSRNSTIIHVADELDVFTRPTLRKMITLAELSPLRVIVSLLNCDYCDASCVGTMISSHERIGPRFFAVVERNSLIHKIFTLCLNGDDSRFVVRTIAEGQDNFLIAS